MPTPAVTTRQTIQEMLLAKFPSFDPAWNDDLKKSGSRGMSNFSSQQISRNARISAAAINMPMKRRVSSSRSSSHRTGCNNTEQP